VNLAPGTRLGPYEIESELGRGGMGEVYRARDTRLGREVAVKILPATHAADPESVRRFEKEARAVASLSHPNVVPLFDIGEQEGVRYAVAELVAGETLRARLAGGPLPTKEATEIAAQIAEGLGAAHQKGIVHRDIKPENVVLTPSGHARILDFGLARSVSAGLEGATDQETQSAILTEPGVIAGTVGYMSPEQVRGEPVDGRSDIFSLGVLLWEMLAGRRPFHGDSHVETLHAILKEEPAAEGLALPPDLQEILRRCLEKRKENRYHSAGDLAHDLRKASASPSAVSAAILRPAVPAPPPAGAAISWRSRILWGIFVAAILAAVLVVPSRRSATPAANLPRTLAVLPFHAISAEGMPEKFGLGLADSLIGHLASVRELTVRPTSAIARYETAAADAAEIGRKLDVEAVLEGTFQKLEGMTRVSVQMTDVSRGAILWSDRIDLPEGRLFELQDTISRHVVEKLRLELDPATKRAFVQAQRVPDRVMEEYLAARARLTEVRISDAQIRKEIADSFDPVLATQPEFAPALGARAYARAALNFADPTLENYRAALSDADRAIVLEPDLAEPRVARASLAWSPSGGWDVVKAVRELKLAISKSPNLDIARSDLARIYIHNGWFSEAESQIRAIERIHPSGTTAPLIAADVYSWTGNRREALERFQRLPEEFQRSWAVRTGIASLLAVLEDPRRAEKEVVRLLRDSPDRGSYLATLAILRARSGQSFEDLERKVLSERTRVGHFHHIQLGLADAHAAAGDLRGAVEFLRQAAENGFPCASCFDSDPLLAPVRGSAEYAALRSEIERRNAGYRAALKDVL
jgi:TolB-like protein/tetratricopeptide (TPR) repeat protein